MPGQLTPGQTTPCGGVLGRNPWWPGPLGSLAIANPKSIVAALGALLAIGGHGVARAQQEDPNPYYIGFNEAINHDTNVQRVSGGPADTYSSSGLVGGFDQSIGRERLHGSGNVTLNRYRDETYLNNTSYALNLGLDWQTIDRLSGSVNASVNQSLANLNNNLLQSGGARNVVRSEQVGTRVSWGGNAAVTVQGGYGYSTSRYSNPTYQASNSTNQSADIGVYYHPGETLSLGTALRYTRSMSDAAILLTDGTFLSSRTNGRNIDLSASWTPTALSSVNARVSFTNQSAEPSNGDGFSGLTGSLGFNYAATGKISLSGQLSRDASTNGAFFNTFNGTTSQPTVGLAANSSVSNSASVGAVYRATSKVNVNTSLGYVRSTSAGNNNAFSGYSDHLTSASLGATWSIRRYWSAGCNLSRVRRRLSGSFDNDYSASTIGCFTQITLR